MMFQRKKPLKIHDMENEFCFWAFESSSSDCASPTRVRMLESLSCAFSSSSFNFLKEFLFWGSYDIFTVEINNSVLFALMLLAVASMICSLIYFSLSVQTNQSILCSLLMFLFNFLKLLQNFTYSR